MHEPDIREYRVKEYFKHKQKKFKKHASGSLMHVISNKCLFLIHLIVGEMPTHGNL